MNRPSWPTGSVRRADVSSAGYRVFPAGTGVPGKCAEHGGLGWKKVTIVAGNGHLVMVDTGGFGMRPMLAERLAERGVDPVEGHRRLAHACALRPPCELSAVSPARPCGSAPGNWKWAEHEPPWFTPLAELYAADLRTNPARPARGAGRRDPARHRSDRGARSHARGLLRLHRVAGAEHPVLFTGDAAKNNAELLSCVADMSGDHQVSSASLRHINEVWRQRPNTVLVPGHDLPLALDADDRPRRIGRRRAHIDAWFGDDLQTTTGFDLTTPKGTS